MPRFTVTFSEVSYKELTNMSLQLDAPMSEVLREALSIYGWLIRETLKGSTLSIQRANRAPSELLIPYLDRLRASEEHKET